MLTNHDVADTLVAFKEDPAEEGQFLDEPIAFLMLIGERVDPVDDLVYLLLDINGYDWEIPAKEVGTNKGYDWMKKCFPRIMYNIRQRRS